MLRSPVLRFLPDFSWFAIAWLRFRRRFSNYTVWLRCDGSSFQVLRPEP